MRTTLRSPSALRHLLAGLMMLALALTLPLATAGAHDTLVASDPEDGQTIEAVPEAVEITFSDTPMELGSQIVVQDADGTDWTAGEPEIGDGVVVQPLDPSAPTGTYTVTWRVVSSDSHPIEGTFEFTATGDDPGATTEEEAPSATSEPAPASTSEAVPSAGAAEQADPAAATESPGPAVPVGLLLVLGIVLVAVSGFVGVALRRRRSR